ncbi:hypothetical protein BS47DRAFT_1384498 [Hydnum rufescens UP504]|uniref:Uncharacterized protein n=1 Tax=Hydnum rufescens UP504 TaxID=1448309 RepID=A0A9P6DS41_9AGAM|nr:hypothetical protein BS47DRAFT_1384498 [Hydnum rufescens UP504]
MAVPHYPWTIAGHLPKLLQELAKIPVDGGTNFADLLVGTPDRAVLIGEAQSAVLAQIRHYEGRLAAVDATHEEDVQEIQQRLSQLHDALHYGADNQPVHDTLAHLQAVLDGTAPVTPRSPQTSPTHGPILEILLHHLDRTREKVTLRVNEDLFSAEYISGGLRDKLRLDTNIRPRFYIKHINAHGYTNGGTKWELVSTTQPLGRHRRELHVVLRTGPTPSCS